MTPERYLKFRRVLEQRQPDLTVIADQLPRGRNMAAIRRTCDAMGVPEMHAILKALNRNAVRGQPASPQCPPAGNGLQQAGVINPLGTEEQHQRHTQAETYLRRAFDQLLINPAQSPGAGTAE